MIKHLLVALLALMAVTARAAPALWEVAPPGSGKARIYLFGTFHALPEGLAWRSAGLDKAIRRSDRLVTEVIMGDAAKPQIAKEVASIIQTHGFTTPDKAAAVLLSPAHLAKLEAAAKAQGLPVQIVPRMKPWLATLVVTQSLIQEAGFNPALGADEQLRSWFGRKPNEGLETIRQQMQIFAGLDDAAANQALAETFSDSASSTEKLKTLARIWASGDEQRLADEFVTETQQKYPAFFSALLTARNKNWIPLLEKYQRRKGVTFVAVGVGHLVGEESVIALLRAKGYRVKRLQP